MYNNMTRFQVNTTEEFKDLVDEYVDNNKDIYSTRSQFIEEAIMNMINKDEKNKDIESNINEKINYIDSNVELLLQMLVGFMFNNEMAGMDDHYKESVIYLKAKKALDNYFKVKKMNEFTSSEVKNEGNNLDFLSSFDEL